MLTRNIRTGIICSLILAFIVTAAIALYADLPHMLGVLASFRWHFLPIILGLMLCNYGIRFLKWQYFLRRLKVAIDWKRSFLIFMSGLSMDITPGKVGAFLKSYLLKRSTGEPMSRTSPVIIAERFSDAMAMLLMTTTGLLVYRFSWQWFLLLLAVIGSGILIIQNRRLSLAILAAGERLPLVSRIAHLLRTFYESSYILFQWRTLLFAITSSLISWSCEGAALYVIFTGLGIAPGLDLAIKVTFIWAISSLIGAASGLPGGLGTADGNMLGLTRLLISPSATLGGATAVLMRLCTYWFGIGLGVIALLLYSTTQHIAIFVEQEGSREKKEQEIAGTGTALLEKGQREPAAVTTHIGDTTR